MRSLPRFTLTLLLFMVTPYQYGRATDGDAFPPILGVTEARGADMRAFRKWLDALRRERIDSASYDEECENRAPDCQRCRAVDWRRVLASLQSRSRLEQLSGVHAFMNARRWVDDRVNYGIGDYWATPLEFLARGGDCEDYAFAKYVSLRRLGFPGEALRLLILNDLNAGQPHAVLLVHLDGQVWVLDNLAPTIVRSTSVRHFEPIYSINELGWWLHRPAPQQQKIARR